MASCPECPDINFSSADYEEILKQVRNHIQGRHSDMLTKTGPSGKEQAARIAKAMIREEQS